MYLTSVYYHGLRYRWSDMAW